jgi:hypothetical protein
LLFAKLLKILFVGCKTHRIFAVAAFFLLSLYGLSK